MNSYGELEAPLARELMSRQALENHGIVSARQSQDQPAFHPVPFPEEELVLAVIASPEAEDPPQDPNRKGAGA